MFVIRSGAKERRGASRCKIEVWGMVSGRIVYVPMWILGISEPKNGGNSKQERYTFHSERFGSSPRSSQ